MWLCILLGYGITALTIVILRGAPQTHDQQTQATWLFVTGSAAVCGVIGWLIDVQV